MHIHTHIQGSSYKIPYQLFWPHLLSFFFLFEEVKLYSLHAILIIRYTFLVRLILIYHAKMKKNLLIFTLTTYIYLPHLLFELHTILFTINDLTIIPILFTPLVYFIHK